MRTLIVGQTRIGDINACCDQLRIYQLGRDLEEELMRQRLQDVYIMHLIGTLNGAARSPFLRPAHKFEPVFRCMKSLAVALQKRLKAETAKGEVQLLGAWSLEHMHDINEATMRKNCKLTTCAYGFLLWPKTPSFV
jgi:hypothetical protein